MNVLKKRSPARHILALMISILLFVGNGMALAGKEKPGATLIVQKKDGQTIKGELLTVKDGTLTLLIYENASKADVQLSELSSVHIVKKSTAGKGLLIGVFAGAATGAAGLVAKNMFTYGAEEKALSFVVVLGVAGGVIGGIVGALKGVDEFILRDGLQPEKLAMVEAKLVPLARFKTNQTATWKFVFTGPSIETCHGNFTGNNDSGYFDFPGVAGYAGTYNIDGNKIILKINSYPSIQFSGQFTAKWTMTGIFVNNSETWSWTAVRTSWTAAVEETPGSESKLLK